MTLRNDQASRHYKQWDDEPEDIHPAPWSQEQADTWRKTNPSLSPWRLIVLQIAALIVVVLLLVMMSAPGSIVLSVAYGGGCVVVPAAMFWRGVRERKAGEDIRNRMMKFVVWELAKIALTIAMLFAAPKLIKELNWLALVASFVVTMKLSWLALWTMTNQSR